MRPATAPLLVTLLAAVPANGQNVGPIELSSGRVVTFERPGINRFTEDDNIVLLLSFRTNSPLVDEGGVSETAKARLDRDASEICEKHSRAHVELMLERFPDVDFTAVGVRIKQPVGEREGVERFVKWTAVFQLTNRACGKPFKF